MILITGGSGHLSRLVAQKAAGDGLNFLSGSHNATGGDELQRRINFDDPNSLDFSSVKTLFLVSAGYAEDDVVIQRHNNAIETAERQGVEHIIYTSLTATGDHLGFALAHRWTEQRLKKSAVKWTVLRNGLYAELIGGLCTPVNGAIHSAFGNGRISAVAREDLAEAAVTVLANPSHHNGQIYELAGQSAWTVPDLALELNVEHVPISLSDARQNLSALPLLPFQSPMLMSIYSASAAGFLEAERSDLRKLQKNGPKDAFHLASATANSAT